MKRTPREQRYGLIERQNAFILFSSYKMKFTAWKAVKSYFNDKGANSDKRNILGC